MKFQFDKQGNIKEPIKTTVKAWTSIFTKKNPKPKSASTKQIITHRIGTNFKFYTANYTESEIDNIIDFFTAYKIRTSRNPSLVIVPCDSDNIFYEYQIEETNTEVQDRLVACQKWEKDLQDFISEQQELAEQLALSKQLLQMLREYRNSSENDRTLLASINGDIEKITVHQLANLVQKEKKKTEINALDNLLEDTKTIEVIRKDTTMDLL